MDPPAVVRGDVAKRLGSVVVGAVLRRVRAALLCEAVPVERSEGVVAVASPEDPCLVVLVPVDGQLEEVGTFAATHRWDVADLGPVFQVRRRQQGVILLVQEQGHDPLLGGLMPDHLRVAIGRGDVSDDRVLLVLGPRSAAVVAVDQALREGLSRGGVKQHQRLVFAGLQACGVVPVHDTGTGPAGAVLIREHGDGHVFPVYQVRADRMRPMRLLAGGPAAREPATRGVVIVEKVVLALVEYQSDRIVDPPLLHRVVELRTVGFVERPVADDRRSLHLVALRVLPLDVGNQDVRLRGHDGAAGVERKNRANDQDLHRRLSFVVDREETI